MRRTPASLLTLALLATGAPALLAGPASALEAGDPSVTGRFAAPFEEAGERCTTTPDGEQQCKPAAGSVGVLPNGKLVYWDALDSIQEAEVNTVAEFGDQARNDMVRIMDLRGPKPTFTKSDPNPASNPRGREGSYLPGPVYNDDNSEWGWGVFILPQIEQGPLYANLLADTANFVMVNNGGGGANGPNTAGTGNGLDITQSRVTTAAGAHAAGPCRYASPDCPAGARRGRSRRPCSRGATRSGLRAGLMWVGATGHPAAALWFPTADTSP